MKSLSKSTWIMFCFDLVVLFLSTYIWGNFFGYTQKAVAFLSILVVTTGIIVLYLKGNYRIREFNNTLKNTYLLFEGVVMTHVLPSLYLVIFAVSKMDSANFIAIDGQPKFKFLDTKFKFFNFVFS